MLLLLLPWKELVQAIRGISPARKRGTQRRQWRFRRELHPRASARGSAGLKDGKLAVRIFKVAMASLQKGASCTGRITCSTCTGQIVCYLQRFERTLPLAALHLISAAIPHAERAALP